MREDNEDKMLIRRFLLGELDEGERQRVEELFMVDGGYRESVLTVESELIEDYLEGSLSEHEGGRFAERFLSSPGQRRKVQVLRAVKKYAVVEVASHSPPAVEESPQHKPAWRQMLESLRPSAPYVYAAAAALIIAVVLGGLWAIRGRRTGAPPKPEEMQRLGGRAGLGRTQPPRPGTPGAHVLSLALPSVSVRGAEPSSKVPLRDGAALIELRLLPAGRRVSPLQGDAAQGGRRERLPDPRTARREHPRRPGRPRQNPHRPSHARPLPVDARRRHGRRPTRRRRPVHFPGARLKVRTPRRPTRVHTKVTTASLQTRGVCSPSLMPAGPARSCDVMFHLASHRR